ncbi:hypothetical protein, conserved [Eimeria brunetti]|uniref:non-specific serine/threonine protein kinase n=1 Tax=Eimeria brunetti TaxID=51314 RepID=U6LAE3_9EIME|nr:hypothetical protein, conserved [Eimeria brunetti]
MSGELPHVAEQESIVSPSTVDKSIQTDAPVRYNAHSAGGNAGTERRRQRDPYFPYFLTLGMACAVLSTFLCKVPEAARGRLHVYKERGDYCAFDRSIPSSAEMSSPTVEPEQRRHVEDGNAHPEDNKEDASRSSSVASAAPSLPVGQLPVYDMWGLPMLDRFEKMLPLDVKRGRDEIAAFLVEGHLDDEPVAEEDPDKLPTIAKALSNDSSGSLIGMTVPLKNVRPLHWTGRDGHLPRLLRINRILGTGSTAIVVEAEDTDTHQLFGMRIIGQSAEQAQWFENDDSFIREIQKELDLEEEGAKQLCGGIPANMVASKKGISVPLYTADIVGVPEAKRVGRYFILGRVQLMERLYGTILDLFITAEDVVEKAREYIGRRLLQIVLKIQQAGLSHNDLKWANMLLRSDGSFLVSDWGSGLPFGKPYRKLTLHTPEYREPQLALDKDSKAYERGFKIPEASSDLWSLGILLYELFTDARNPYLEGEMEDGADQERQLAQWLIESNARSASLEPTLEAAETPTRWRQLILRLLEPCRSNRITAWGILEEFPDLVYIPE